MHKILEMLNLKLNKGPLSIMSQKSVLYLSSENSTQF
jgi:hypothetical protein